MPASNLNKDGIFEIQTCPIIGSFGVQRFRQWSPEDAANWYIIKGSRNTKEEFAMYPALGRAHINYLGLNQLIFNAEPRGLFKSVNFWYSVVGDTVYRIDNSYSQVPLVGLLTFAGPIYFTYLIVNTITYAVFVDSQKIYIYQEGVGTLQVVTDPNAPGNFTVNGQLTKPGFIASFGNRIVVSVANSSQFVLSAINLVGNGATPAPGYSFDPNKAFTNFTTPQVFAQESGFIRQMGVLNNTLYIFTDYTTGIWSNRPSVFSGTNVTFPWSKNSTYDWNFGIGNPTSLDINFGFLVFLGRSSDGLLQFMVSTGDVPKKISTNAVDTLLQRFTNLLGVNNPFLSADSNGFLYEYENNIFYRYSGGPFNNSGILDQELMEVSIEYNFQVEQWSRCIEVNGERNRIQYHVFYNFQHLVSLIGDNTVYNMSGQFYYNEIRNIAQSNPQEPDAYLAYPMRYERVTPILYQSDYSEFEDEYVQIDFVFGDSNITYANGAFANAQFLIHEQLLNGQPQYIIAEQAGADGQPVFILGEIGNTPGLSDLFYNTLFKPSIELFFSNNGGILFHSADVREFSQIGVYSWRMRWYQLGTSRNRVYKLIGVSPVPLIILGAVRNTRRVSGGAN